MRVRRRPGPAGETYDIVLSNHVLHLGRIQLQEMLADTARLAGRTGLVVHRDIARSRAAYALFATGTWPFAANLLAGSFIRADGLTSIRRSYTPRELEAVAPAGWVVRRGSPHDCAARGASRCRRRAATLLDHDVLIVGAGPVGLLLAACSPRTASTSPSANAAKEMIRAAGRSECTPGLQMLDRAGVGAMVRSASLALEGGDVLCRGRILASLDFSAHRPVRVLPQQRTHALLRERLQSLSAGALRPGCSVRAVRDEGVRAARRGAAGRPAGGHRGVRRARGRRAQRAAAPGRPRLAAPPWPRGVHDGRRPRRRGRSARPATLRAWGDRRGVPAARRHAALGAARQRGAHRGGVPGGDRRADRADPEIEDDIQPTGFVATQHLRRTVVRGRVALLGDAAHEISPIGGQGMNLGWVNAGRLATALRAALVEGEADLGGYARGALRAARAAQRRSAFYMTMGAGAARAHPLGSRRRASPCRRRSIRSPRPWGTGTRMSPTHQRPVDRRDG
jgi:2-polyprenyl-6-methoxyphenol hydroxylase-like FAD-dependent oxidoreductase